MDTDETIRAAAEPRRPPARHATAGLADWPLHPFFLAAYSVVALYASNLTEMTYADAPGAMVLACSLALVFLLGFSAVGRGFGPRAAIPATIAIGVLLFYPRAASWVDRIAAGVIPADALMPATFAAAAALILAALLAPFRLTLPNALLNGVAFVLFIVPAWKAGAHEWRRFGDTPARPTAIAEAFGGATRGAAAVTPDIYYLIFDRYASGSALAAELGYDNAAFLDFLRRAGFYVASDSHSNYLRTAPSLASTLQMDYLDYLRATPGAKRNEWRPIYETFDDHRVGRFLKTRGYRYIQIGSWWRPTQHVALADENHSFGPSEFNWLYLRQTALPQLLQAVAPGSALARQTQWDNGQCRRAPLQFEKIRAIGAQPEPTFTFAHILLPHEPFVFDADGTCLTLEETWARGFREGYLGQLAYTNRMIEQTVTSLLARPGPKPVIILQADEGPYPERYRTGDRSWRDADRSELVMKTAILNAYHFPSRGYAALYPSISPVNSFRVLFNALFGTRYALLPDRIVAYPDSSHLYDFFDVTEIVRGPGD